MTTLHMTRGLPASGKTTFAKAWVAEAPQARARVNRDDLRMALFGKYSGLSNGQENAVTEAHRAAIKHHLTNGIDVICDDTNLNAKHAKELMKLAANCGAKVEFHDEFLVVPLPELLSRDRLREKSVGADVITSFYNRYLSGGRKVAVPVLTEDVAATAAPYVAPEGKPEVFLVDLDGTIAHNDGHRSFYEWSKVGMDKPIPEIIDIVQTLFLSGLIPIFVSGRDAACFPETHGWISKHVFKPIGKGDFTFKLLMRGEGDQRKDSIVKLEIFDTFIRDNYNVRFCLDDRQQVVDAYRSIGLRVLQVAPGNF